MENKDLLKVLNGVDKTTVSTTIVGNYSKTEGELVTGENFSLEKVGNLYSLCIDEVEVYSYFDVYGFLGSL